MKHLKLFEEWGAAQADEYERHFGEQEPAGGKVDIKSVVAHPKMKAILAELEKRTGKKTDSAAVSKAAEEMMAESKRWSRINEEVEPISTLFIGIGIIAAAVAAGCGIDKWISNRELKKKLRKAIDEWCHKNRKEQIQSSDDVADMVDEIYDELKAGKWENGTPEQQQLQKDFNFQISYSKKGSGPHFGHTTFGGGTYGS